MQVKTKLEMPVHLRTPMGQTYVKPSSKTPIGDMSFHFDKKRPYVDFSNTAKEQVFANGTHPGKVYFLPGWKYDRKERFFEGKISFEKAGGYFKNKDSELMIYFDEDLINIERSDQYIYKDQTDKIKPFEEFVGSMSFGAGVGLKRLEY